MSNRLLESALYYASIGWPVFPCIPRGKTPATPHGVKDATADAEQIRAWWAKNPDYNIAVACGLESGVHVIDVDVDADKGVDGWKSLNQFTQAGNAIPETIRQRTPRGGAHFFYRSDSPPANRNSFVPGIDIRSTGYYVLLTPSIHPNGGEYAWDAGHSPLEMQPADYPDFMRPQARERQAGGANGTAPSNGTYSANQGPASDEALRRASLYLATCDSAIKGQAGHDKLLWAAGAMVHGCGLSDAQAYDLLAREYNPRCIPSWNLADPADEKDFRRKISEARKHPPGKPYLWILDDPAYAPLGSDGTPCTIDVEALLGNHSNGQTDAESDTEEVVAPPTWGQGFPRELRTVPGFLGEYVAYCMEAAPYPNEPLALAGGLALLSAVTGRKLQTPTGLRTNLYIIALGFSGAGKNFIRNLNSQLLTATGAANLLAERMASAEGIEDRLFLYPNNPVVLFQSDEFDAMIAALEKGEDSRHQAIGAILNELYTASGMTFSRRVKAEQVAAGPQRTMFVNQPHVVLLGTAIPQQYYKAVGSRLMQNGFCARTLAIEADLRTSGDVMDAKPVPARLVEEIRHWVNYRPPNAGNLWMVNPTPYTVPLTDAAKAAMQACRASADKHYGLAFQAADAGAAAIWARVYEQTWKLATLYAVSENCREPKIDQAAVQWARGVSEWQAKRALTLSAEYGAESFFQEGCKKLFRAVKELADKTTKRALHRKVSRRMKEKVNVLKEYAAALADQGRIIIHTSLTANNKTHTEYEVVEGPS